MCPYAYQTSVWIRDVREQIGLDITWRFFSLEEVNRVEGKRHPWERPWSFGWGQMRVGSLHPARARQRRARPLVRGRRLGVLQRRREDARARGARRGAARPTASTRTLVERAIADPDDDRRRARRPRPRRRDVRRARRADDRVRVGLRGVRTGRRARADRRRRGRALGARAVDGSASRTSTSSATRRRTTTSCTSRRASRPTSRRATGTPSRTPRRNRASSVGSGGSDDRRRPAAARRSTPVTFEPPPSRAACAHRSPTAPSTAPSLVTNATASSAERDARPARRAPCRSSPPSAPTRRAPAPGTRRPRVRLAKPGSVAITTISSCATAQPPTTRSSPLSLMPRMLPGAAADRPHLVLGEADALPARGDEQQLVVVPAREHAHDPVAVGELHRDDAVLAARRLGELRRARCASRRPARSRTRGSGAPRASRASSTATTCSPSPNWNRFCAAVSRSLGSSCTVARYARPRSVKNSTPASADVSITCAIASRSPRCDRATAASALGHGPHVAARGHGHDVRLVLDERDDVDRAGVVGDDLACGAAPCARRGSRRAPRGSRPSARRAWRGCASAP